MSGRELEREERNSSKESYLSATAYSCVALWLVLPLLSLLLWVCAVVLCMRNVCGVCEGCIWYEYERHYVWSVRIIWYVTGM